MIADDDDLLPPDAIDIIRHSWVKIEFQASVGGIAGLDVNKRTGEIIGSGLPKEHILCNAMDIRYRYHVTGDLKEVFRTDVLKDFPFPEIAGEMFCPEQLVWFRIAQKYSLYYINRPIYIAEYQSDGITAGITRARMKSPRASMLTYAELTTCRVPFAVKVKAAINYWRFWYCRRADTLVPPIARRWYGLRPVGWMMHRRDTLTFADDHGHIIGHKVRASPRLSAGEITTGWRGCSRTITDISSCTRSAPVRVRPMEKTTGRR